MHWLRRLRRPAAPPAPDPVAEARAAFGRGEYGTALGIWEPLARAGDAEAQAGIGLCFLHGLGIPADPPLAEKWLSLAAAGGHAKARRELAELFRHGAEGVEADPGRATQLYRAAAEGGDPVAQDVWSLMLLEGQEGVPVDIAEARRWALAAAGAGIAPAMTRLGMLYHNAQGVERDVAEAARWWHGAALRGDADGQAMFGAALHLGAGVAPDPVAAMAWLLRATRGGSALARPFLSAVRAALTPAQLSQALARSSEPLPPIPGEPG
ncbi:sel1 repeat family protein (plasmid) [Roseomonas gilardii subsp. gilardii]|uniref:tetratricopeptide repeat protein n=1 Tax=Roseomonas gilardii TaxID=257708 RepID=UPI001FF9A86F|nr:tetratricopeptide repeat protein [Roseomonas gilardii]UPG74492.1 sel1 repeat family protein [Roseomonas gilardii subsp. gilardii]